MTIESKYSYRKIATLVVTTLGFVAAIISLYAFFVQAKKVDIRFEIIANTNVLDINADVSRLDITYNGMSLKEKNEHLRIINIRIINRGTENILKEFYDDNDPLGFKVSNGKIIEKPEVVETSNNYLKENLKVEIDSTDKIKLSKVIMEPKESIVLKLLILHKSGILPEIIPTGKIAGMKEISVINIMESKDDKPFFIQVFYGSLFVQTVRAIAYFLILLALIIIIGFSIEKLSEFKQKHKRKRLVEDFKNSKTYSYSKMDDAIFDRYIKNEYIQLANIKQLLVDRQILNIKYNKTLARLKKKEESKDIAYIKSENASHAYYYTNTRNDEWYTITIMFEDGYIIKEKDQIIINQPMKNSLDNFLDFLKSKNAIDSSFNQFMLTNQRLERTEP